MVVISVEQEHFALLVQKQGNWHLPVILKSEEEKLISSKIDLDIGFTTLAVEIKGLVEDEKTTDVIGLTELELSSVDDFVDKSLLFPFTQARKRLKSPKERSALNLAVEYWYQNHLDW